jgi:hypothetical protein
MNTSRIRMGHPLGQTPPNIFTDFDWIRLHEKELLEKYGECSLIVYKEQVLGFGATYDKALENAEQNLPLELGEVTPVHRKIFHRHPFYRVRPTYITGTKSQ